MKQLLISFLSLVIVLTTPTFGQVDSVTDQYMGNGNLLVNPGLESGLKSWTNVAGVLSVESSVVIKGKRAGKVVLSSQALNLYQDVTSYQAQLADGVQGLASIRVKTSVSGLRVCPRQAGIVTSTLCVSVVANNKWGLYKVPFSLGATSNGISINSNGTSVSGTVYFDDSFMGPQELSLETNACNSVNCETEFSAYVADGASTTTVSNENLDWLNGNCTNPSAGTYTCTFQSGIFTTAPNCVAAANATSARIPRIDTTATDVSITFNSTVPAGADANFNIICQKQGSDFITAKQRSNGNTYSSKNADTDWASCTPSSSQGFGTPTYALQCKRQGGDLLMKGRFTPSATTAVEARLGLPVWNGLQLVSASTSVIPNLEVANGFYVRGVSANAHGGAVLIEPSVSYITFGPADTFNTAAAVALSKATANNIASTETLSFNARIPIEGWQNSNIIIGQFNGLESCANTLECTDVFSAFISSAGAVSQENVDWINGNCTLATSTFTCNYNTLGLSNPLNCSVSTIQANTAVIINASSSTQLQTRTYVETTSALTPYGHTVVCQKQGVDYIGKTAKAVASDQNVRSVGAVGVDIQSVYFSGSTLSTACSTTPCVIYRQVGSKITSVSRVAIGQYNINGIDGTKYQCTGTAYNNAGLNRVAMLFDSSASSSTQATISSQGVDTSYNSIICIGVP